MNRLLQDPRVDTSPSKFDEFRNPLYLASANGHLDVLKLLFQDPRAEMHDEVFDAACARGHPEVVEYLMSFFSVNSMGFLENALCLAVYSGHLDVFKVLLSGSSLNIRDQDESLCLAAERGHLHLVKYLLDNGCNPGHHRSKAFRSAAQKGHLQVAELLLQDRRVDPSECENEAIRHAATHGHWNIVNLLLCDARVDPAARRNEALRGARDQKHEAVMKLLLSDSRVDRDCLLDESLPFVKAVKSPGDPGFWEDALPMVEEIMNRLTHR